MANQTASPINWKNSCLPSVSTVDGGSGNFRKEEAVNFAAVLDGLVCFQRLSFLFFGVVLLHLEKLIGVNGLLLPLTVK